MIKTYTIVSAIIKSNKKYLIAKRADTKKFAPGQWELISGFVENHEAAEDTIVREIKEELGVESEIIKSADPFILIDNEGKWIVIPFLVTLKNNNVKINPHDHSELKWVTLAELKEIDYIKENISSLLNSGILD